MAKVRVSTLAKEFGMTSKELMGHLAEMKIPAKSASSTLEDAYVAMVRKQLASVIEARAQEVEAAKQAEADRKAQEKAEAEAEKQRLKEEEADRKRQLKLEDEARRRQQKLADEERRRQQKLADEARRKAERRAAKIESQLISAGGQVLKRGLLGVLKKR